LRSRSREFFVRDEYVFIKDISEGYNERDPQDRMTGSRNAGAGSGK
jgi:hypothetical protein